MCLGYAKDEKFLIELSESEFFTIKVKKQKDRKTKSLSRSKKIENNLHQIE